MLGEGRCLVRLLSIRNFIDYALASVAFILFTLRRFLFFVCFCYLFHPVAAASTQLNEGVKHRSELSDDDPLYDSVASDEDYVTAEQLAKCLKLGVCTECFNLITFSNGQIHEKLMSASKNSVLGIQKVFASSNT